MRTIKGIYTAEYAPVEDLITYSPLPSAWLEQIDPFLFLNHHGPQQYPSNNHGLPFGPHPHRGMETVTFILDGDIMHQDSAGHESIISSGGVQWMTAGRGILHAEVSSGVFKEKGGNLEILQLWINLPARLKMTEPRYIGLQKDKIPEFSLNDGNVTVNLISGEWGDYRGAFESLTNVTLTVINFKQGGKLFRNVPRHENVFFYIVRGGLTINGKKANFRQLVDFNNDADELYMESPEETILLFGHAKPLNEPVKARGPFVMNTDQEIADAYNDYRKGKFGTWEF